METEVHGMPDRERFIVPARSVHPFDACELAVTALAGWADEHPDARHPLAVFNALHSADNNEWMAEATRRFRSVSWRTRHRAMPEGAAVLLFFPSAEMVGWYEGLRDVPALFVVESSTRVLDSWRLAHRPVNLATGAQLADGPRLDPVVRVALRELTARVNTNDLVNQEDVAAAVRTLEVLRDGGNPVDPAVAEAWALTAGWSAFAAARLREFAEKVRVGRRFRLKDSSGPRREDLERWRRHGSP